MALPVTAYDLRSELVRSVAAFGETRFMWYSATNPHAFVGARIARPGYV